MSKTWGEFQPGRRRVCEYRQGHRGGLGLWAGSEAGSPRRGIWSGEVGTLVSPPQSSGHTACETPAASPGALTWPWLQSLSSCTPQNHSLWSAPWWGYTPESNAPGYQKVGPTPQTAAGWRHVADLQYIAEHRLAAAAQRSPFLEEHAGVSLWWHTEPVRHSAASQMLSQRKKSC